MKEFKSELNERIDHLTRCVTEGNQKQFLNKKENERLAKMNEQLLREKVETEVSLKDQIKKLEEK